MAKAQDVILEEDGTDGKIILLDDIKFKVTYDANNRPKLTNVETGISEYASTDSKLYPRYKAKNEMDVWIEQIKQTRLLQAGKTIGAVQQEWVDGSKMDFSGKLTKENSYDPKQIGRIRNKWIKLLGEPKVAATRTRAAATPTYDFKNFEMFYGQVQKKKDGFTPYDTSKGIRKKVEPSETPSKDPAVIKWKEKWLWRGNKDDVFYEEHDKSPLILFKVLVRLKDDTKPNSLGVLSPERWTHYQKYPNPVNALLRRGDANPENLTKSEILDEIIKDLQPLMEYDVGEFSDDPHPTAWYTKAKAMRGFLATGADFSIIEQPADTPLAQTVNAWMGRYSTIHLTFEELEEYKFCIEENIKNPKPVTVEEPKFFVFNLNANLYKMVEAFNTREYEDKSEKDTEESKLKLLTGLKKITLENYKKKALTDNKKMLFSRSDVSYDAEKNKADDKNNHLKPDFIKFVEDFKFEDLDQTETSSRYLTKKKNYIRYHHYYPTANTWRDVRLVYWLGLELGLRKTEMITLSAFPTKLQIQQLQLGSDIKFAKQEHGVSSGLFQTNLVSDEKKIQQMSVQAITWKTAGMGELGQIAVQNCLHNESNELFKKRQDELKKKYPNAIQEETPINFLGDLDQYATSEFLFSKTRSTTGRQQAQMDLLQGCIKHCFAKVGKEWQSTHRYFFTHPLHSWRHIFAQYWLEKTDFDYEWVANRGHWTGIEILRKSYGEVLSRIKAIKNILAAQVANVFGKTIASQFETSEEKIEAEQRGNALNYGTNLVNLLADTSEWKLRPVVQYYRAKSEFFSQYSTMATEPTIANKKLNKQMRKFESSKLLVDNYNEQYKNRPNFVPAVYVENQELLDKMIEESEDKTE